MRIAKTVFPPEVQSYIREAAKTIYERIEGTSLYDHLLELQENVSPVDLSDADVDTLIVAAYQLGKHEQAALAQAFSGSELAYALGKLDATEHLMSEMEGIWK